MLDCARRIKRRAAALLESSLRFAAKCACACACVRDPARFLERSPATISGVGAGGEEMATGGAIMDSKRSGAGAEAVPRVTGCPHCLGGRPLGLARVDASFRCGAGGRGGAWWIARTRTAGERPTSPSDAMSCRE